MASVTLTWTPAGGSNSISQVVQYKPKSVLSYADYSIVGSSVDSETITGLLFDVLYDFRILNDCIAGDGGEVPGSLTESIAFSCPQVLVTSTDSTVSFSFPGTPGTDVTTYVVLLKDSTGTNTLDSRILPNTSVVSGTFTGLIVVTDYIIQVVPKATGDIATYSKNCPIVPIATKPATICNPPVIVDSYMTSVPSLVINFTDPIPAPDDYIVQYRKKGTTDSYLTTYATTSPVEITTGITTASDYEGFMISDCNNGSFSTNVPFSTIGASPIILKALISTQCINGVTQQGSMKMSFSITNPLSTPLQLEMAYCYDNTAFCPTCKYCYGEIAVIPSGYTDPGYISGDKSYVTTIPANTTNYVTPFIYAYDPPYGPYDATCSPVNGGHGGNVNGAMPNRVFMKAINNNNVILDFTVGFPYPATFTQIF